MEKETQDKPESENKNDINSKKEEIISKVREIDKWEEIGAHRPLGQLWYTVGYSLIAIVLSVVFLVGFISWIFPFPEIRGYFKIADQFFLLVFQVFDMGTAYSIDRFIGEWRVKDEKKMIKYVQFFFWYQMITGLIQIVIISVAVLKWLETSNLVYLSWIFLLILIKQYPAITTSLKNTLGGLQRYDKHTILEFLTGSVTKDLIAVGFIVLGRIWGENNPKYGAMFGATIGLAVGGYLIEFIGIALGAKYFNEAMAPFGYSFKDAFRVDFDKEIVKECLIFGAQVSIIPSINTLTTTAMLLMYVNQLPQYTSYVFIAEVAGMISGVIGAGGAFRLTPSIAESYPNGKENLALFYIQTNIKWAGFFMMLMLGLIGGYMPMVLSKLTNIPDLQQYALAVDFLPFFLFQSLFTFFINLPNQILLGTMRVTFYTFVRLLEEAMQVLFVWLYLYVFRLQDKGAWGIGIIFGLEHFFPRLIKMLVCYWYINRKVFKIKIYWMQCFIIPLISVLPTFLLAKIWELWIIDFLINILGLYVSMGITLVVGMIISPLLIYLPLMAYLGGWDEKQMELFKKSVELSGPSKFFVKPFYKMTKYWVDKSKFHNKFKIPWKKADKEILELHLMKLNQDFVVPEEKDQNMELVGWFKKKFKNN